MILADVVDAGRLACLKRITVAASLRVPAGERVALASGKSGRAVVHDCDLLIVRVCGKSLGLIGIKVAVVGDGDRLRLIAVNSGQGNITVDRDLALRIVHIVIAVRPVEEDLVIGGGARTVEDGGGCALAVAVVVGNRSVVAARGDIGHAIAGLAAELGDQREVVGDLGVRVEGLAVLIGPAEEVLARGGRGVFGKGDSALVRNLACCIFLTFDLEGDRMHRRDPLGINGDILRRHGLAGEDILLFTCRISIPTGKLISFFACGSSRRVAYIADILLIFFPDCVNGLTVVNEDDIIAVAGVVEFGIVIRLTVVSAM